MVATAPVLNLYSAQVVHCTKMKALAEQASLEYHGEQDDRDST
jgi:hypothetical protein